MNADELSDDIHGLFMALTNKFKPVSECLTLAKNHARDVIGNIDNSNRDRFYAIALVHLYTQQCDIDEQETFLYCILNKELREGKPSYMWERTGNLLNRAIDFLGKKQYGIVFRGQDRLNNVPKKGDLFRFGQMASTSTEISVPVNHIEPPNREYMFIIKNAVGLYANPYSYYDYEEEVLLKYTAEFKVGLITCLMY